MELEKLICKMIFLLILKKIIVLYKNIGYNIGV